MRRLAILCVGLMALFGLPGMTEATPIVGSIGFTGSGVLAFSSGGSNFIDWCPLNGGGPAGCNGHPSGDPLGVGRLNVGAVTGSFVVDAFGTGTILDMTDDSTPPANYTYVPAGTSINVSNFLNFSGENWIYTLTFLTLQTCAYIPGKQLCVGPLKFTDDGVGGVAVTLSGLGYVTNSLLEVSTFVLNMTAQYNNLTVEEVASLAGSTTGAFSNAWSGQLVANAATIPEPATLVLFGTGTALAAAAVRRRWRNKSKA